MQGGLSVANTKNWVPTELPKIDIHFDQVPKIEMKLFCLALAKAAERYFEDPQHQAEFEEWRENQRKEEHHVYR